jgi:two-component system, NarL family, response regulator NreC
MFENVLVGVDGGSDDASDPQRAVSTGVLTDAEAGPMDRIRLVLADDHPVVRAGLRMLLESDRAMSVDGEVSSVAETLAAVVGLRPDVLVLDLNLGGESGLEAIPLFRERAPGTGIVVLTMQEDPAFARAALRAGALGYVLKDAADSELLTAISMAADGRTYLNPELGAKLAAAPTGGERPDGLSPRELEVLKLIALGHTNAEIAATLTLSVRTVESHRAHIHQKVPLANRVELVAYARGLGLLD